MNVLRGDAWGPDLESAAGGDPWLPDEDALVVVALPQAAVALVGHGEDVGGQLPQVALAVALHGGALIQAGDGLVGVQGGDDGADVGLQGQGHSYTQPLGRGGEGWHRHPCWAGPEGVCMQLYAKPCGEEGDGAATCHGTH